MARKKKTDDEPAAPTADSPTSGPAPEPAAPEPAAPKPTKPAAAAVQIVQETSGVKTREAIDLLQDCCEVYGVNPDATLPIFDPSKPHYTGPFRELMAWRFYPGDKAAGVPDSVSIVTCGGLKLRHYADPDYPMDEDTDARLARIFNAFRREKDNTITRLPLPDNLTLPDECCDGVGRSTDHAYQRGYLREGGKKEAARRTAARK